MPQGMIMYKWIAAFAVALAIGVSCARGQDAAPYAIDIPSWFATTFLDFREDIADAAKDRRRLLIYFGQDGCPYCKQLMVTRSWKGIYAVLANRLSSRRR